MALNVARNAPPSVFGSIMLPPFQKMKYSSPLIYLFWRLLVTIGGRDDGKQSSRGVANRHDAREVFLRHVNDRRVREDRHNIRQNLEDVLPFSPPFFDILVHLRNVRKICGTSSKHQQNGRLNTSIWILLLWAGADAHFNVYGASLPISHALRTSNIVQYVCSVAEVQLANLLGRPSNMSALSTRTKTRLSKDHVQYSPKMWLFCSEPDFNWR